MLYDLVTQARRAKARELGRAYSFRALARDAGISPSRQSRILRGVGDVTAGDIERWADALAPHLDRDRALVEAGLLPRDPQLVALLAALTALPPERRAVLLDALLSLLRALL